MGAIIWGWIPLAAHANNGLNLIGFGAESEQMAGADIAVARDTSALNTNPAGLTQIARQRVDLYGAAAYALDVAHADQFGNDREVSNKFVPVGSGGYARRIGESGVVVGVGVFVQGGAGSVYKNLHTAFGTQDEMSALFGVAKFSCGAAYRVNDSLSLGASLAAVTSRIDQKFFPNTSSFNAQNPAASFYGFSLQDANGVAFGGKLGAMFKATDTLSFAATFANRIDLPQKDGNLDINMSSLGIGTVHYANARLELVSIKWDWLNWAAALRSTTLLATGPDNPAATSTLRSTSALGWSNQSVFAIGAAYSMDEGTTLRAGYNYGKNPISPQTLNPLLAATGEHHLTCGLSMSLGNLWEISTGAEYLIKETVTYANAALPFGNNAQERNNYIAFHLALSRSW